MLYLPPNFDSSRVISLFGPQSGLNMESLLKYRFQRKDNDKIQKATLKDTNKGPTVASALKTAVLSPIVVPDSPPRSSSNRESSESPIIQVLLFVSLLKPEICNFLRF